MMDHDLETEVAAVASAGGFLQWRKKHALPAGSLCRNCNARLVGPWCHACGQLGEDFHRNIWHLVWEVLESFFHADGRLIHTLPRLVLRPASLTHAYLGGQRASQIPPLRLFLVVLLLVFVTGNIASSTGRVHFMQIESTPKDIAEVQKAEVHLGTKWDAEITEWTRVHLGRALTHPDAFVTAMGEWAHDVAFLTLPVSALLLGMLFAFRRGFVMFDHLIFSMHSLSFQGLLFVVVVASAPVLGKSANWLLLASPVHLFLHMRGTYGTGWWGTVLRMSVLATGTLVAFSLLLVMLAVLGMAALRS